MARYAPVLERGVARDREQTPLISGKGGQMCLRQAINKLLSPAVGSPSTWLEGAQTQTLASPQRPEHFYANWVYIFNKNNALSH